MHDVTWSATRAVAVTPSDTAPISFGAAPPNPPFARRLWVAGATGTVTVVTVGGDTVQYAVPVAGVYLHVCCTQVKATGTTSQMLIVAEY